ncbi:Uncharacterized protein EJ110_NYTH21522 [Nymphaea thermarum]|nr:Uncharacterized protein EJ110_NYTH21522 [Nymphaea thermarum]
MGDSISVGGGGGRGATLEGRAKSGPGFRYRAGPEPVGPFPTRITPNEAVPQTMVAKSMVSTCFSNPRYANIRQLYPRMPKEPWSVNEGLGHSGWKSVIYKEMKDLMENQTWHLVSRKENMNAVGFKWKEGISFHETFSPIVCPTTIRNVLFVSTVHKWEQGSKIQRINLDNVLRASKSTISNICRVSKGAIGGT